MMTTTTEFHSEEFNNKGHQRLCGKLRNKAIDISNGFRKMFGLPTIERLPEMPAHRKMHQMHQSAPVEKESGNNLVHILPVPFIGTETRPVADSNDPESVQVNDNGAAVIRHGPIRMRCHRASFLRRVHRALMTLGPWEGRAVAFVLGCGIGVIFRMIWVMTIVTARLIKSRREEAEYELVYEQDAEDILVPPPQYTDEKVEAVDVKVAPQAEA